MLLLTEIESLFEFVKDLSLVDFLNHPFLIAALHKKYESEDCNTIDGLKIDFPQGWVHLRKSNTEPIIRVYAEHDSLENAQALVTQMKNDVDSILN